MLWSLILPFEIAVLASLIAVCIVTFILKLCRQSLFMSLVVGVSVGGFVFFPAFSQASKHLDKLRFGQFHCATVKELPTEKVAFFMPPLAESIDLDATELGHRAKFKIRREDLVSWVATYCKQQEHTDLVSDASDPTTQQEFDVEFKECGWIYPSDLISIGECHSATGAGIEVWFSPSESQAYLRAAYF